MALLPSTSAPACIARRKRSRKIVIPVDEYPTYNFIGLIIGPRGKTQKDMESKTGCKIAIRGKGSVKEGARGRRNGAQMDGDNEPLHVLITGDDPTAIDAAAEMVESMLVVIDDEKNVHKQNQLRELALLNGTLKDEDWCHVCGEKGHRDFECPRRFGLGGRAKIQVKCAICGDTSHPTRDCTMGPGGAAAKKDGTAADPAALDSDYMSFMAELDGKKAGTVAGAGAGAGGGVCLPAPTAPAPSGYLTVIQPARVVGKGGGDGESDAVAKAAATAAAGTVGGSSFVTTISSNVGAAGSTAVSHAADEAGASAPPTRRRCPPPTPC